MDPASGLDEQEFDSADQAGIGSNSLGESELADEDGVQGDDDGDDAPAGDTGATGAGEGLHHVDAAGE